MARKHRRRRSSFRELVMVPGLGFLDAYKGSVGVMDVLLGMGLGLAGGVGLQYASTKLKKSDGTPMLPDFVRTYSKLIGSVGVGIAAYYAQKKSAKAKGHLVGASVAGASLVSWDAIRKSDFGVKNGLSELVMVPGLGYGYGGVIVDNPAAHLNAYNGYGYGGVIVDNPAAHLNALSASAMGDVSGMEFMATA